MRGAGRWAAGDLRRSALLRECGVEPQITQMNADLQRLSETYAMIGAGMKVHRELGNGVTGGGVSGRLADRVEATEHPFPERAVRAGSLYRSRS